MSETTHTDRAKAKKISKMKKEKKRRDRINVSLRELGAILKDANSLNEFQCARMEKAEILEAAVEYLKERRKTMNQAGQIKHLGYNACANEILRYLATNTRIDDTTCAGLRSFLNGRCPVALPAQNLPQSVGFHIPEATSSSDVLTKPSGTSTSHFSNEITVRSSYGLPVVPVNRNGLVPYIPYNIIMPYPTIPDSAWKQL